MGSVFTKDWQSFAEYDYQLDNWIRWSRDMLKPQGIKAPGWVNLIEYEPEYRQAKRDPVWILDAERFDEAVIQLPKRLLIVLKLHFLNRYTDELGRIRFVKTSEHKPGHAGVSRATFYRDLSAAERLIQELTGLESVYDRA